MDEKDLRIQALEAELAGLQAELRRIKEEKSLDDPDHRLRTLMEQTPDHVYFKDLQSRFISVSRAVAESFHRADPSEVVGKTDFDFFAEDHARRAFEDEQEIIRTGMPKVNMEEIEVWPDGECTWVSTTKAPFRGADGTILGTFGISRDITARKRAEEAMRVNEEKLRLLFENAVDGILLGSPEGIIIGANDTICAMTGYAREELIGLHVSRLFTEKTLAEKPLQYALLNSGDRIINERDLLRKDGTVFPIEMNSGMMPDRIYHAIVRDLSERRKTLEALQASETSYRGLFDSVLEAIYIQDREGRFLDVNRGAMEMYGWPREFFIGQTPEIISAPGLNDLERLKGHLQRAFEGEPQSFEFWGMRKNGETFPKEIRLYKGTYRGQDVIIAMARDISERKHAERALQESERHYRELLDRLQEGFAFADTDERFVFANPAAASILGVSGSLVGVSFKDFLDAESLAEVERQTQMRRSGGHGQYELVIRRPDGEKRVISLSVSPWLDDDGHFIGSSGLFTDVTERKQAEQALRASEAHFRELLERLQEGFAFLDTDECFVLANPSAAAIFGIQEDLVGRNLKEFLPDEALALVEGESEARRSGRQGQYEHAIRRPDGELRTILVSASPWMDDEGHYLGSSCLFQDITERQKAEKALRESESNFRNLLNKLGEGFAIVDTEERWAFANPAAARIFGLEPGQLVGHSMREFVDEKTYQEILNQTARRKKGEASTYEIEICTANGEHRYVALSATPFLGENGEYLGADGLFLDMTERKQAELALLESQERYRELFTNTTDAIFWIRVEPDGSFIVESVNPAEEALVGKPSHELAGKTIQELFPEALATPIIEHFRQCIEAGHPIRYEERVDFPSGAKDFQTLLVPIAGKDRRIIRLVGFAQDITQAKHNEEALRQAQKLESLGVLAGGIAHDFNNLLTAILGNLNLAQMKISEVSPARLYLENVERTILKAAELTKQMLAYSGKGRFVVSSLNLNQVVQEMTHLLKVSISKRVQLSFDLCPALPLIEADAAQIQQVVMNLVTNASEAIGDRDGEIRITTSLRALDRAELDTSFPGQPMHPGSFAVLEIADTGSGIPPGILERIFDPFFSTKQSGRGLGLSAMQGILRGHRAGIRITSELGRGSTFRLYFPAAQSPAFVEVLPPARKPEGQFRGCVLLADDEPEVREVTSTMLQILGFEVITAVDGLEAVTRYAAGKDDIDLVLLDLTMPRMDGRETFLKIRSLCATVPVILYSGYSEHESIQDFLAQGSAEFLQKPFQMADLRRVIQRVMTQA